MSPAMLMSELMGVCSVTWVRVKVSYGLRLRLSLESLGYAVVQPGVHPSLGQPLETYMLGAEGVC